MVVFFALAATIILGLRADTDAWCTMFHDFALETWMLVMATMMQLMSVMMMTLALLATTTTRQQIILYLCTEAWKQHHDRLMH